jgi:uncharacterized damage-inducible protein DinB
VSRFTARWSTWYYDDWSGAASWRGQSGGKHVSQNRRFRGAADIVDGYGKVTTELVDAVKNHWDDDALTKVDDMFGQKLARGASLSALISHEIHHRGQMTVLLRQAGCRVPGLLGPAKEEWPQFGMETPPY